MFTISELDEHVTHDKQTEDNIEGPVVLVNIFHVKPEEGDELTALWGDVLREFKSHAGYISAQFHAGIAGSGTFLVYSVWESVAHYSAVYNDPDFRSRVRGYPDGSVATPHLFRKVAIPGVCVA